jgi:hypothetical protein
VRSGVAAEPPLSENDPMYFIVGGRDGYSARFQLSLKYRLFDQSAGLGQERPWLAGFYFGYTQNSLWDLSEKSKAFRDTSYKPSLFWKWDRSDDQTWIDSFRVGVEHESNGGAVERSRSVNTVFGRTDWRWTYADDSKLEFTPRLNYYFDKGENPGHRRLPRSRRLARALRFGEQLDQHRGRPRRQRPSRQPAARCVAAHPRPALRADRRLPALPVFQRLRRGHPGLQRAAQVAVPRRLCNRSLGFCFLFFTKYLLF